MATIKLNDILAENMRRFSTKNLSEQDTDQNDNGYPDQKEDSVWRPMSQLGEVDFLKDVKQEKVNFQWVANIADASVKLKPVVLRILKRLKYTDPRAWNGELGFEIRQPYEGQFGYRGYIFLNLLINDIDIKKIQADPEFNKYFQTISKNLGASSNPSNSKLPIMIQMKPTPLPR